MKKKRVKWTSEQVSKAFPFRKLSKRSYVYIKDDLKYPLPGLSSLQQWTNSIDVKNGILEDVLKNPGVVSKQSNTTDSNNEEFMIAKKLKQIDLKLDNVKEKNEDAESSTDTISEGSVT